MMRPATEDSAEPGGWAWCSGFSRTWWEGVNLHWGWTVCMQTTCTSDSFISCLHKALNIRYAGWCPMWEQQFVFESLPKIVKILLKNVQKVYRYTYEQEWKEEAYLNTKYFMMFLQIFQNFKKSQTLSIPSISDKGYSSWTGFQFKTCTQF